jgi:hypothetical protein
MSDYGLGDRAIGVGYTVEAKDFSSSLCVQTGSGTHPASCTVGTRGPFSRAKARPGRDVDHSSHIVSRSGMSRSYTSSPPCATMMCSGTALPFTILFLWSSYRRTHIVQSEFLLLCISLNTRHMKVCSTLFCTSLFLYCTSCIII